MINKSFYFFGFVFSFFCMQLFSETIWDDNVFELENTPPPTYLFSVSGEYIDVDQTHFTTEDFEKDTLHYRQWNLAYALTYPFNEFCGLIFGAGWVGTEVDMDGNPNFDEKLFNYVNLSAGGFTNAFPDWTWTLTVAAFIDSEVFSLIDYTLYQGVLWGRYQLSKCVELDFGLITEIGLHKEKIWPILGFIYLPSPKWRINAIYPVNLSLEYDYMPFLTFQGSIRFLRNRHRVKVSEFKSQAIFEYRDTGAEFDVVFAPSDFFSITGFIGSTFNGDLKVTDRNNHHAKHYKFEGSFYSGISAVLSF